VCSCRHSMPSASVRSKRQPRGRHLLVIIITLVDHITKYNHDAVCIAHPGMSSYDLISLNYWWPGIRKSIEDYVKRCDPCQRRKGERELLAPLVEVEEPTAPFEVKSMDVTGPYLLTPRKNRYLLTFTNHFTRYVEVIPIPDQAPETCDRVYATQMITQHGTGSKLIIGQCRAFMSTFFQRNMQNIRNPESKYHQLPLIIKWNGRTIAPITSHRSLTLCQRLKHKLEFTSAILTYDLQSNSKNDLTVQSILPFTR